MKARTIPVRRFRQDLFRIVKRSTPYVITSKGRQEMFLIPYEDIVRLVELLENSRSRR